MKNIHLFFSILTLTTIFLAACGESYYKQDQQESIQFDLLSNEGRYVHDVNVDSTAPPDLLWNNVGFYFNNDSTQILIKKLDETQNILSICAVYNSSDPLNDLEDIKKYWMDRQLSSNEDFEEFLQDINPYLRNSNPHPQCALLHIIITQYSEGYN